MNLLGPILAFFTTSLLIVLLHPFAKSIGLVDVPSKRKNHQGNIPLIGGVAIFVGTTAAFVAHHKFGGASVWGSLQLPALFAASFLLVVIGMWDDYAGLPPVVRFVAQITAALVMIFGGGVVLADLGNLSPTGGVLFLGFLSIPFTIFSCLGIINAMNMSDGLDGLSGSLAIIALLGLGVANFLWGNVDNQVLIVTVSACVFSFLMFNLRTFWRSNAWVFLGDAGSMLLGLMLCWLLINMSQGEQRVVSPAAALWFLMVPIYDTVALMLRRIMRKRSPFEADREHLHHIFLLAGFSVGESVTLMCGIAVVGVVIGLGGTYLGAHDLFLGCLFLAGGGAYFWVINRSWRVMRFLQRSINRRGTRFDRREIIDRRIDQDPTYAGPERRSGTDRRKVSSRREQC
jgi:UDP-GlcNAc:undecaprenyl-phosphate GlcNAc-1-phosphate transferase